MITVEYLAPGTGASAVELDDFLDQFATDSGFSSLQSAVTAAAGKHLRVCRNWTITTPVDIPDGTTIELTQGITITQATNATSIFTFKGTRCAILGPGTIKGTNSETATTAAVTIGGDSVGDDTRDVTIKNLRVQNARYGIKVAGITSNFEIVGNWLWGGISDGNSSADIFVVGTSFGAGFPNHRGLITQNFCLSNNDNGIYVNGNDGDREMIVANNMVCPLQSDGVTRLTNANVRRRFGITMSYNGGTHSVRTVNGNLAIGCAYCGFYATSNTRPVGSLNFNANTAMECGFGISTFDGSDAGIRAGAFLSDPGRINGRGNMSINCYSVGLKIQDRVGYSDTTASRGSLQWHVEGTRNPTITASPARGVYLVDRPSGLDLDLYVIHGTPTAIYAAEAPTATEAAIIVDCTNTGCGDVTVGGRVEVTNGKGGIQITAQVSGTEIDHPIVIDGMSIHGTSKTDGEFNSAIWYQGNVHIRNATIKTFDRGINYATTQNSRRLDLVAQNIFIEDTDFGLWGSGTGLLAAEGISFKGVGTERNGPWVNGTKRWDETGIGTVKFTGSAIPSTSYSGITTGFARGDHCEMSVPSSGSPKGWMRDASTWVSTGNL